MALEEHIATYAKQCQQPLIEHGAGPAGMSKHSLQRICGR
jgi:hypothetical protein